MAGTEKLVIDNNHDDSNDNQDGVGIDVDAETGVQVANAIANANANANNGNGGGFSNINQGNGGDGGNGNGDGNRRTKGNDDGGERVGEVTGSRSSSKYLEKPPNKRSRPDRASSSTTRRVSYQLPQSQGSGEGVGGGGNGSDGKDRRSSKRQRSSSNRQGRGRGGAGSSSIPTTTTTRQGKRKRANSFSSSSSHGPEEEEEEKEGFFSPSHSNFDSDFDSQFDYDTSGAGGYSSSRSGSFSDDDDDEGGRRRDEDYEYGYGSRSGSSRFWSAASDDDDDYDYEGERRSSKNKSRKRSNRRGKATRSHQRQGPTTATNPGPAATTTEPHGDNDLPPGTLDPALADHPDLQQQGIPIEPNPTGRELDPELDVGDVDAEGEKDVEMFGGEEGEIGEMGYEQRQQREDVMEEDDINVQDQLLRSTGNNNGNGNGNDGNNGKSLRRSARNGGNRRGEKERERPSHKRHKSDIVDRERVREKERERRRSSGRRNNHASSSRGKDRDRRDRDRDYYDRRQGHHSHHSHRHRSSRYYERDPDHQNHLNGDPVNGSGRQSQQQQPLTRSSTFGGPIHYTSPGTTNQPSGNLMNFPSASQMIIPRDGNNGGGGEGNVTGSDGKGGIMMSRDWLTMIDIMRAELLNLSRRVDAIENFRYSHTSETDSLKSTVSNLTAKFNMYLTNNPYNPMTNNPNARGGGAGGGGAAPGGQAVVPLDPQLHFQQIMNQIATNSPNQTLNPHVVANIKTAVDNAHAQMVTQQQQQHQIQQHQQQQQRAPPAKKRGRPKRNQQQQQQQQQEQEHETNSIPVIPPSSPGGESSSNIAIAPELMNYRAIAENQKASPSGGGGGSGPQQHTPSPRNRHQQPPSHSDGNSHHHQDNNNSPSFVTSASTSHHHPFAFATPTPIMLGPGMPIIPFSHSGGSPFPPPTPSGSGSGNVGVSVVGGSRKRSHGVSASGGVSSHGIGGMRGKPNRKPELSRAVRMTMFQMLGVGGVLGGKYHGYNTGQLVALPAYDEEQRIDPETGEKIWRWDWSRTLRQSQNNANFANEIARKVVEARNRGDFKDVPMEDWDFVDDSVDSAYTNLRREREAQLDPSKMAKKEAHRIKNKKRGLKEEKVKRRKRNWDECKAASAGGGFSSKGKHRSMPNKEEVLPEEINADDVERSFDIRYVSSEEECPPDQIPTDPSLTISHGGAHDKSFIVSRPGWRSDKLSKFYSDLDNLKPMERAFTRYRGDDRDLDPPFKTPDWMIKEGWVGRQKQGEEGEEGGAIPVNANVEVNQNADENGSVMVTEDN